MEWQLIETAPKDGSMFICWVDAKRWSSPDGNDSSYEHDVSQADFCWWRRAIDGYGDGYFDPSCGQIGDWQHVTHWMPLPPPPKLEVDMDLPKLPEPWIYDSEEVGTAHDGEPIYQDIQLFTAEQMQEYARQAVLIEREAIIDLVAFHGGSVEIEAAIRART